MPWFARRGSLHHQLAVHSFDHRPVMPQLLAFRLLVRRHVPLADRHQLHPPLALKPRFVIATVVCLVSVEGSVRG